MKKVLMLRHGNYPDDPRLKKQTSTLRQNNYQVDIICLKKGKRPLLEREHNLNVYRLPYSRKRGSIIRYFFEYSISFIVYFLFITFMYFKRRYDFIVIHTLPDYLSFTTIIPKLLGSKIFTDFHEPTPELVITKFNLSKNHFLVRLTKWFEQAVIKYSNHAIAVTESWKRKYIERGADAQKITVISNVCEENFFQKKRSQKNRNNFILVTHGAIEERYGHETVIRAIHQLKEKKYTNIKYLVPGAGTYKNHLANLVKRLNLEGQVEFLGYLDFKELNDTVSSADVGVIAMYRNPYSELIDTNKMYEYIDLKLPVIVSRLSPIEDNFDDLSVMYFEPGDSSDLAKAIEKLYVDPVFLSQVSENGFKRYEQIKWSKMSKSFLEIFEKTSSFSG